MSSSYKYEIKEDTIPQKAKTKRQEAMLSEVNTVKGTVASHVKESQTGNCFSPRTSVTNVSITLADVTTTDMTSLSFLTNRKWEDNSKSSCSTTQSRQILKWPLIRTKDETRIRKEKQLHDLMSEIDNLMVDVGLQDKTRPEVTFELIPIHVTSHTAPSDMAKHQGYKQPRARVRSERTKRRSSSQEFVDDLEKLLDTCDQMECNDIRK